MNTTLAARVALITASILAAWIPASAVELPTGFIAETLATNLNAATAIAVAPDGRIFVADQTGPLRVWKDGQLLSTPALDLTGRVDDYWERGLIGVTLHPDFPRTPHLFLLYVAKSPFTHHVLSRFTLIGDRADPGSEFIVLEGDDQRPFGGSQPGGHQGGPIRFGPDGKLYIALGEQTAGEPAQSLAALQGKILRLHSDGSIPQDNPFYTRTTGKYRAIWALGLRNPFGLAFQPETGRLFESDVGQSSWEEVNEIVRGANYGWPRAEGVSTNLAFKNPLHAYPPVIGLSIVGGAFYPKAPGKSEPSPPGLFPEKWRGKFFFADWAAHWVKAIDPDAPTNVVTFARNCNGPVAIELTGDGSLLVLNRGTIWRDGKRFSANSGSLVRIRYTGGTAPAEKATPIPEHLSETGTIQLSGTQPRDLFEPFQLNAPVWLPGVTVRRWLFIPQAGRIHLAPEGDLRLPAGAMVVQQFESRPAQPFETHVYWFGSRYPRAAAYQWDANGRDATLVEDGEVISLPGHPKRHWFSPGAEPRLNLETTVTGFVLQLNTRQLNRGVPAPGGSGERTTNQLSLWNRRGWFEPPLLEEEISRMPRLAEIEDATASLESRIRSYLDANCAVCHRPGGPSRGAFDARFSIPLTDQHLVPGELQAGDLGIAGARLVFAGSPERSVLYERLKRFDFFRMPPVSVNDEPSPALPVLVEWIRQLK
jgi:glucose/arabinose dehydrogenase